MGTIVCQVCEGTIDILKMKNQQYYTGNVDLIANVTIKNIQKLNNRKAPTCVGAF